MSGLAYAASTWRPKVLLHDLHTHLVLNFSGAAVPPRNFGMICSSDDLLLGVQVALGSNVNLGIPSARGQLTN